MRQQIPGYRVFVFGVEVTEDVTSLKINQNDARLPGTCEFVLTNDYDRYVVTPQEIPLIYKDVTVAEAEDIAQELSFHPTFGEALDDDAQARALLADIIEPVVQRLEAVPDEMKRRVLTEKIKYFEKVEQPSFEDMGSEVNIDKALAKAGFAARYPLRCGDRIFHSNDAVRVFLRDPDRPDKWHFGFTGFVSDTTDEVSENNEKIVTIRCEGPLRTLRYARLAMNPGIFDIGAVSVIGDAVTRSFYNAGFTDLSLPEYLFTLLFGSDLAGTTPFLRTPGGASFAGTRLAYDRISVNGRAPGRTAADGVGAFDFQRSAIFILGPEAQPGAGEAPKRPPPATLSGKEVELDSLATYQAVIDSEVRFSSLRSSALRDETGQVLPQARALIDRPDMTADDTVKVIGENPHLFPVDYGALYMLLPGSLGPSTNRSLLDKDLIQSVATETTFRTRMDMIFDVLNRIEFSLYETPRGDLIVEPPLYNLDPVDFGSVPLTGVQIRRAIGYGRADDLVILFEDEDEVEGYAGVLTFRRGDVGDRQTTFSDEKVRTIYASSWQNIQGLLATGTGLSIGQAPRAAIARSLLPQFGARAETSEVHGFISSPQAAQLYAEIKLSQINADAVSTQVTLIPRVRLLPNRPVEIMTGRSPLDADRMFTATVRSIDTSITWGSESSMSVGLNYQRAWAGGYRELSDGKYPLYVPLGGSAGQTLDYAKLFAPKEVVEAAPAATPEKTR